uniref:Uncharacterized protein n=1 Tax=Arundo donax TaxID=35708 RepID=A0A0A9A4C5_ARUDO
MKTIYRSTNIDATLHSSNTEESLTAKYLDLKTRYYHLNQH